MLTEENKKYKENKTEPKANHLNFSNKHFRLFFPINFLKVSFVCSSAAQALPSVGRAGAALVATVSPAANLGLSGARPQKLQRPDPRAQAPQLWRVGLLLGGKWDLRTPGSKPGPPASAGRFATSEPPGEPPAHF